MNRPFNFLFLLLLFIGQQVLGQNIFDAARTGDLQRMADLIKIKPDTIHKKNASGFTPLIIAAYRNQVEAVKFLLDNQVDVNADSPEGPVILGTCYKGNLELTRLLIRYNANINAVNTHGTSALMYAVMSKDVALVKLLLTHGAKKDLIESSGRSALDYARDGGSTEMIDLLSN